MFYATVRWMNFDEKDFQVADYVVDKLSKKKIDYLRETHIELFYKDIPIHLGAPDFL